MSRRKTSKRDRKQKYGGNLNPAEVQRVSDSETEARQIFELGKFVCFDDLRKLLICSKQTLENSLKSSQVSVIKVIPSKHAKAFYKQETGEKLDLKSVKNYEDEKMLSLAEEDFEEDFGVLGLEKSNDKLFKLSKQLDNWYKKLQKATSDKNFNHKSQQIPILGIVYFGKEGFLQGENKDEPFVLPLQSGINIFIGDRGSGKSTVLEMISLLQESFREKSQNYKVSELVAPERQDFHTQGNTEAHRILKKRSVDYYTCYFHEKNNGENEYIKKLYVFYANIGQKFWCLFERVNDEWISSAKDLKEIFPNILVLHQGRVQSLVESTSNLVINQILEVINFDLKEQYYKLDKLFDILAQSYYDIKNLAKKQENDRQELEDVLKIEDDQEPEDVLEIEDDQEPEDNKNKKPFSLFNLRNHNQTIERFIEKNQQTIKNFRNLLQNSKITETLNQLESHFKIYNSDKTTLTKTSLLKLIKSGEPGLIYLYMGLIADFLDRSFSKIKNEMNINQSNSLDDLLKILEKRLSLIGEIQQLLEKCYQYNDTIKKIDELSKTFNRTFSQLSYGQKTGIILTILSIMTPSEMIVIDQPEDNLDSDAVANIITPTFSKVSKERVLTIATHNSSLVIGLRKSHPQLFVMKKPTEFGGIVHSGKLNEPQIVESVFDILEDGFEGWRIKSQFFQESTKDSLYTRLLEDQHFSKIIAELRNAVQPRIIYEERLKDLRHIIKNSLSNSPNLDDSFVLESTPQFKIFNEKLLHIINCLAKQDYEILERIKDIKGLSTDFAPENIDLFDVLNKMKERRHNNFDKVEYWLDPQLEGVHIFAVTSKIKTIFYYIFDNATEAILEVREWLEGLGREDEYKGSIEVYDN